MLTVVDRIVLKECLRNHNVSHVQKNKHITINQIL
jgi:hypothetical protein